MPWRRYDGSTASRYNVPRHPSQPATIVPTIGWAGAVSVEREHERARRARERARRWPSASSVVDGSAVAIDPEREHRVDVCARSGPERDHGRRIYADGMTFRGWPQEALDFYVGLEADNSKSYFEANKAIYDECVKAPFLELSEEIEREFGPLRVFRPNRDIRFSKDKTPYKIAAAASTENEGGAAFYVQISAAGLYVGSGFYHLASDQLERYRVAVADARSGPKLATAVDGIAQAGLRRRLPRVAHARAARVPPGPPAHRLAPQQGHARGQGIRRAPRWLHTKGALERIEKAWRDAGPMNRWLQKNVGPSTLPPPEPR